MFYTIAKDDLGNISGKSATYSLNVDTVNAAPVITGAYDDVAGGVYNGLVGNGGVTNDKTPELRGTAEPGSVVYIVIDNYGTVAGSVKADANGSWKLPIATNYNQQYNFHAYSVDPAGNRSADSAKFAITVDTVNNAPVITGSWDDVQGGVYNGLVGNGGVTNDRTLDLRGTAEAGSVVYIINPASGGVHGSTTAGANGQWSFPLTTNYNQTYNFQAYSVDKAGNRSVNSTNFAITVDTVVAAPNVTVITDNVAGGKVGNLVDGERTNDNRPTITGNGAEAGAKIEIVLALGNQGWSNNNLVYTTTAKADGTWSLEIPKALQDGTWYFRANQTDQAGNKSALGNQHYVVVDTVAAAPVITAVVDNVAGGKVGNLVDAEKTNDNRPTITGNGAEAGAKIEIWLAGPTTGSGWTSGKNIIYTTTAKADGTWSLEIPTALPDGTWYFRAKQIDTAGNSSALGAQRYVTVETWSPENFLITSVSGGGYFDVVGEVITVKGTGGIPGHTVSLRGGPNSTLAGTTGRVLDDGTWTVTLTLAQWRATGLAAPGNGPGFSGVFNVVDTSDTSIHTYNAVPIRADGMLLNNSRSMRSFSVEEHTQPVQEEQRVTSEENKPAKAPVVAQDEDDKSSNQETPAEQKGVEHVGQATEGYDAVNHTLTLAGDAKDSIDLSKLVGKDQQVSTIDMNNGKADVLNINVNDVLTHAEKDMFIADGNKQLMVQGNKGDVVNLSDLLPDNTDPGNWTNAGNVKVSGVEYQVYQMENLDVELLVQNGVTVNVNNH